MKRKALFWFLPAKFNRMLAPLLAAWPMAVYGANNTWSAAGGTGNWDTTTANWSSPTVWNNASGDTAVFGGTAGTVTLTTGITAGGLTFNTTGYTVTGNTLSLNNGSTILLNGAGVNATVNSAIAGPVSGDPNFNGNFTISGSGAGGQVAVLGGTNTFVGSMTVNSGGIASIAAGAALGHQQSDVILDNGTLRGTGGTQVDFNSGKTIRVGAGGGTLDNAQKFLLVGSNTLAGSGTLTKTGAGTLQPTRANTGFTGNIVMNGGVIENQNRYALGYGTGQTITMNAGELVASSLVQARWTGNTVINHAISYNGGTLSVNNGPGGTFAGPITINAAATQLELALRNFAAGGTPYHMTISGAITGASKDINITKSSTGGQQHFLSLSGNNSGWTGNFKTAGTAGVGADVIVEGLTGDSNFGGSAGTTLSGGTIRFAYTPGAPAGVAVPGFNASYYNYGGGMMLSGIQTPGASGGNQTNVSNFMIPAVATRIDQAIAGHNNGAGAQPNVPLPANLYAPINDGATWTGTLNIATGGDYSFFSLTDDGSQVYIDGKRVVDNDYGHGFAAPVGNAANNTTGSQHIAGGVNLSAGAHSIVVKFTQATGGGAFNLDYSGPDTNGIRARLQGSTTAGVDTRTAGSISSARNVTIAAASSGTIDTTSDLNYTGNIAFTSGASTLNFTSNLANTITVNNGFAIPGGAVTTLNSQTANTTFKGAISELAANGQVTFGGFGTSRLEATNSFTGAAIFNGATYVPGPFTVSYANLDLAAAGGNSISGNGLTVNSGNVRYAADNQIADAGSLSLQGISLAVNPAQQTASVDLGTFGDTITNFTLNGGVLAGSGSGLTLSTDAVNSWGAGATDQLKLTGTNTITRGTLAIPLHGTAGLTWNSTGNALGLAAVNDYTGLTTVAAGALVLNGPGTLGAAGTFGSGNETTVATANNSSLQLINGANANDDINITGNGTGSDGAIRSLYVQQIVGGITGTLPSFGQNNTNTVTGAINLTGAANIQADGMTVLNLNGAVGAANQNLTLQGTGRINFGSTVNLGTGTLTGTGGVHNYTGAVTAGALSTGTANGPAANMTVFNGPVNSGAFTVVPGSGTTYLNSTLGTAGAAVALDGNTVAGGVINTGGGNITIGGGDTTFNAVPVTGAGTITRTGTGALLFGTDLAAAPALLALATGSSNRVVLNGTQTFGPATVPAGGRWEFGSAASIPGALTVNGTAAANYAMDQAFLSNVAAGSGGVALGVSSSNNLNFTGIGASLGAIRAVGYTGTLTPDGGTYRLGAGGSVIQNNNLVAGPNILNIRSLLGNGSVTVSGGGVDLSERTQTFAGNLTVSANGVLKIRGNDNLGAASNTVTLQNGGVLSFANPAPANLGQGLTFTPGRSISIGTGGGGIDVAWNSGAVLGGVNALSGTGTLTKTGLGELQLGSANDFGGNIVLGTNGGVFFLKGNSQLTSTVGNPSITVNPGSRLDVDRNSGIGPVPTGAATRNQIADNWDLIAAGGTINYSAANSAGNVTEAVRTLRLDVGQSNLTIGRNGQGAVFQTTAALGYTASNAAAKASILRIVPNSNTLGFAADNPRVQFSTGALPADATFAGGNVINGATFNFLQYDTTLASYGDYGSTGYDAYGASLTSGTVANLTADATLGAGGGSVNAVRLSGGATRQILFNATTPGTLFVESGGILSENVNNARNIGTTTTRGTLTAGPSAANAAPRSLYLMQNQSTLTVNSVIVNNNSQPVSVVKGLDGVVTLSATNTYTGGTYVLRGTLEAGAASALGQGDVFVKNARLNLAAAGAIGGGTARTITARDNAEVLLTGTGVNYNGTSDRFDIGAGSILMGPNTSNANVALNSLTRVTAFTGGGQVILAPDAIVSHQSFNSSALNGIGSNTIKFATPALASAADLYYGLTGTVNNSAYSVTVGSGTPWKGISTDRNSRTFQAGTIYANSDFWLQGLTRDGGVARLTLGAGSLGSANGVNIVSTTTGPVSANLIGDIFMDEEMIQISPNISFELTPNSFLTVVRPNQFGSGANVAAGLHIQSGATLDVGSGSPWTSDDNAAGPLNVPVVVDGGGRILSNEVSGLGAGGAITLRSGAVFDIASQQALIGANGGRITWENGAIARIQSDSPFYFNSRVGQNATIEIFNGNRALTSQVDFIQARDNNFASNPYAPLFTPQDLTINGGILTNDAGSRSVTRGAVSGQIVIGPAGGTIAASSNTILTLDDDIRVPSGNTLTIGSLTPVAGQTKIGNNTLGAANGGAAGAVALNASNANIIEGTVNILDGAQLRFTGVNVWPDNASINLAAASASFPASTDLIPSGSSLLLANAQPEVIASLTGNGTVLSNQGSALGVLAVGHGGGNSTFNGVFSSSGTQQPSLSKIGNGTLTLTGNNTSTGTLAVQAGDVVISGAAGKSNWNSLYLTGGRLILDNSAAAGGALDNRLNGKDVSAWGGELLLRGNGTTPVVENAGLLRIGSTAAGVSGFQIPGAGYVSVDPNGSAQTNLTFTQVQNSFVTGGQTAVFRGPGMAGTPGTTAIDGSVTAAAASNGLIRASANTNLWSTLGNSSVNPSTMGGVINGGGQIIGSIGTPVAAVRGDILGSTSLTGTGSGFVTSDTFASGYRLLAASEKASSVWAETSFARNTALTGTHNVGGGLTTIQTLELTGATVNVGSTIPLTANPSRFNVNTGGILTQAGTASSITAPVLGNFGQQATMYFWNHGDLTVNSRMHLANGFVKNGTGELILGADALASVSSGAQGNTINGGKVTLTGTGNNPLYINYAAAGSFFFTGQRLQVNNGGTLDLGGRSQIVSSLFSNDILWGNTNTETAGEGGTITSVNPAVLTQHGGAQFGGHITGAITLNHAGSNGTGDLILTGTHSYTGATITRTGFISLRDNAALLNTFSVEINHANFELTNTGIVQLNNRLGDTVPVNMRGGLFQYIGGRQASAETIGTVNALVGNNTFTIGAGQSTTAELTVTNLARSVGSTVVAQATAAGASNTIGGGILGFAGTTATNPRLFLSAVNGSAVTLNDGILGGWATDGSNWLTYDATNGVQIFGQPQNGTAKYSGNPLWAGTASDNINIGQFPNAGHTVDYTSGNKTINSLRINGAANISLQGTLTVDTGGVLSNVNSAINFDGGSITPGGSELFFTVGQNTTAVQSAIVNNGGAVHVVKSGGGTLALHGDNTNTGNLYVNGGTVQLNNLNNNKAINGDVFIAGGTVTAQRGGQMPANAVVTVNGNGTMNWAFPVAGGTDTLAKVVLNNIGANAQTSFGGSSTNVGSITLTDPVPIVAVTDSITQPTAVSNAIPLINFAPSSGTTSTIDVSGSAPLGLVFNAGIGTIPSGGVIKAGAGLMSMGGSATGQFGNPGTPNTLVLDITGGGIRVDNNNALGPVNAVTRVNAGTYLLGGNNTNGITGSIQLNGGLLGVTAGNTTIAGNIEAAAASAIRAFEYYELGTNRAITHTGLFTGSADITLEGSPLYNVNGSPFVLGNTGNTYSGNWLLKPNSQLRVSAAALTGNTLGTSTVKLQGGMLDLRDNNANTFNNNFVLEASSRINVDRATANANNVLTLGTLTLGAGSNVLNVTGANGYTLGVAQLAGSGTLLKGGQTQMTIGGYAGGFSGSAGIAGASGIGLSGSGTQHTYNTTTFDNLAFTPAVNAFTNFTNAGFYITPASKTIAATGTFEVAANPGNLPGALGVRNTSTITAGTFTNNGQVGPVGGAATVTATGFNGTGHYNALGSQMNLAGNVTGGVFKVTGDNVVQLTGTTHALAGAEVQSGTLRIDAAAPVATSGNIRVFGSAADTTLKQGAVSATLDLAAGSSGITHTGNITNNGLVKVSTGTATVSGIIGGTATQYVPGLREGLVDNGIGGANPFDASSTRAANSGNFGIRLEPRMGQTNAVTQSAITGWGDNQMYVYTGWVKDTDGIFSFAENIDDNVLVSIDGVNRLVGNGPGNPWQTVTGTALSAGQAGTTLVAGANTAAAGDITNSFGAGVTLPGYGDGWHRVEIRVANGVGGAGPVPNNGFGANYGIGFSPDGVKALDGGAYVKPIDDGTGNLFVTEVGGKGNVTLEKSTTLTAGAAQLIDTIKFNDDGGAPVLNLTGSTGPAATSDANKLTVEGTAGAPAGHLNLAAGHTATAGVLNVNAGGTFHLNTTAGNTGTLSLTGTGTGTGAIHIARGLFELTSTASLPTTPDITIDAGAEMDVTALSGGFGVDGKTITVNGTFDGDIVNTGSGLVQGSGTITGTTTLTGGTISPGNSPGVLNTGSVTTSGTSFQFEIDGLTAGTDYDRINTAGTVSLGGTLVITFNFPGAQPGDTFDIWLNDGGEAIAGTFTGLAEGASIPAGMGSLTITYAANADGGITGNDVRLTYIPEPGSALLAAAGLLVFARRRRA